MRHGSLLDHLQNKVARTADQNVVREAQDPEAIRPQRAISDLIVAPAAPVLVGSGYSGMLSCFFQGVSTSFSRSMASARATRRRVEWGMITSST